MRAKRLWTIQSFFTCFLWNAVLVGAFFYLTREILLGLQQWVTPLMNVDNVPEDVHTALLNLNQLLNELQRYAAPLILGGGALITFILWLFILFQGRGLANRAVRQAGVLPATAPEVPAAKEKAKKREAPAPSPEQQFVSPSPQAAVQMLSILQREGRLIDFLQEDLSLYEDAQIGAAVRNIHQGCKAALSEYVDLEPIFREGEGSEVTIPDGFDAKAIRLTGNVTGEPPFRGTLRHRGWRVARLSLPQSVSEQKKDWVLAPAEVEIGEPA